MVVIVFLAAGLDQVAQHCDFLCFRRLDKYSWPVHHYHWLFIKLRHAGRNEYAFVARLRYWIYNGLSVVLGRNRAAHRAPKLSMVGHLFHVCHHMFD